MSAALVQNEVAFPERCPVCNEELAGSNHTEGVLVSGLAVIGCPKMDREEWLLLQTRRPGAADERDDWAECTQPVRMR